MGTNRWIKKFNEARYVEPSKTNLINITFNSKDDLITFGKYKNTTIRDLIKNDISYANWLLGRDNIKFSDNLRNKIERKFSEFKNFSDGYPKRSAEKNYPGSFSKHDYSTLGSEEEDRDFVGCFYDGDGI